LNNKTRRKCRIFGNFNLKTSLELIICLRTFIISFAAYSRQKPWFLGLFSDPDGITLLRRNPPRPPEIRINGAILATGLAPFLGFLSISSGDQFSWGIEHPEMSPSPPETSSTPR
jgi:hypothetical protein